MTSFRDITLKKKLIWLTISVTVVSLFLSAIAFLVYQWDKVKQAKVEESSTVTDVIGASLSAAIIFNDQKAANELLDSFRKDPDIRRAQLITPDGRIFAQYSREGESSEPIDQSLSGSGYQFVGTSLFISKPVTLNEEVVAHLYVEDSIDGLWPWLKQASLVALLVLVLGSIVALILTARFEKIISGPVLMLTNAIREVSLKKNYDTRVGHNSKDEIGTLIHFFNEMLGEIQARDVALRSYHEDLERKVAARTHELTDEVLQRTRIEEALRREQQQLQEIIKNSPVAIAMFDVEMRYLAHSKAWLHDYGLENQNVIGKSHYEVFPDIPEEWKEIHRRCLSGIAERSAEDRFDRADGSHMYLRWAIQPWFLTDGTQGGVVMVTHRIDELVSAREAALQTAQIKSTFLANMSHELRTPLNGIIGFTDLLLEVTGIMPEHRSYSESIKHSSSVLLHIIHDILDFSKLERGMVEIERLPLRIDELIENTIQILRVNSDVKGIGLNIAELSDIPNHVMGDSFRVQQVLINLIGNAIKFTRSGGISVSAKLLGESQQECIIQFSVTDSGIGIPSDKLEHIFEAFSQADGSTTRKYGGTGLGLSISLQLVRLMGGRIWVESQEGIGSTFHFTIHFGRMQDAKTVQGLDQPITINTSDCNVEPSSEKFRILVAEDNVLNQKLISTILTKAGHQVLIAGNGVEALQLAKENRFDVILMDIQMPVMGGLDATRAIRGCREFPNVPIIALTADTFNENRSECMASGMTDFISKPIDRIKLLNAIENLASIYRANC